jgi:flagellar biosynthesis protein FlhF
MVEELRATRRPKERALALLHEAGFEGPLARELATGSHRAARQGISSLREWLCSRIGERLVTSPGLIVRPGRQLIACIGPSGAGKTTTLAKLAARGKLEHGRSVGILSLDTYRVGAVEQWQRYAQLLGVPFTIARGVEEFDAAVRGSMCDLLLVDTPGRTTVDKRAAWPLPECLNRVERYQVHAMLVLPAWLRARDAEQVARAYSDAPASGTIVTKVDETTHRGGALQAAISNTLPLAYVCDGPRVPEDIRDASQEIALKGLLAVDA